MDNVRHFVTEIILSLYTFQVGVFMYSYFNNLLPSSFDNLFQCNEDLHKYNTRRANNTRSIYGRTALVNSLFLCQGPTIWNNIPIELQQCKTIQKFKSKLKKSSYEMFKVMIPLPQYPPPPVL